MNEKTYVITDYGVKANSDELQTEAIQRVLDLCGKTGGTVVIPEGRFTAAGLLMHSDTTILLKTGAVLLGSEECTDYAVCAVPEGVELRTDMELIDEYYRTYPYMAPDKNEYRRAIISAYGAKNIAIIGEEGSLIDGQDCFDPKGEEGFRGPHGIFLTNCENITLRGYTIQNNGNFMHQLDNCVNTDMRNVVCLAGHDGIHLHHCVHTLIEDCRFITGDDCIAGINFEDLIIRRCELNTSCQLFRIGGHDMLVEDCRMYGPGYYPHRKTVVRGKHDVLSREEGRHNLISMICFFASSSFPSEIPYGNLVFRRCSIDYADCILHYYADGGPLENGAYLGDMTFEDVKFTNVLHPSDVIASEKFPTTIYLKNVEATFRENSPFHALFPVIPNFTVVEE